MKYLSNKDFKIYFGAPLFSEADLMYNEYVVDAIYRYFGENGIENINIYLPQDATDINDKTQYANSIDIARYDTHKLLQSDIMVALLDGDDTGVSAEVGIAYQSGIPIIGLFTDSRQQGADNQDKLDALKEVGENQFIYTNLFVVGIIKDRGKLTTSVKELSESVLDYYKMCSK